MSIIDMGIFIKKQLNRLQNNFEKTWVFCEKSGVKNVEFLVMPIDRKSNL